MTTRLAMLNKDESILYQVDGMNRTPFYAYVDGQNDPLGPFATEKDALRAQRDYYRRQFRMRLGQLSTIDGIPYRVTKIHHPEDEFPQVGLLARIDGEVYEITRIIQEGDTRIVTAVPYVGKPITIRIGG